MSAPDEVDNGFKVKQRLADPVQTDEREQPVFDLIPFAGARRIVADRDRHGCFVTERLQMEFPGTLAVSVTAAAVGADEQSIRSSIEPFSVQTPPAPDALHGEFGRIVS